MGHTSNNCLNTTIVGTVASAGIDHRSIQSTIIMLVVVLVSYTIFLYLAISMYAADGNVFGSIVQTLAFVLGSAKVDTRCVNVVCASCTSVSVYQCMVEHGKLHQCISAGYALPCSTMHAQTQSKVCRFRRCIKCSSVGCDTLCVRVRV